MLRLCYVPGDRHLYGHPGGGEVLPIMSYTGRLRPKGVPFSGFRYRKSPNKRPGRLANSRGPSGGV